MFTKLIVLKLITGTYSFCNNWTAFHEEMLFLKAFFTTKKDPLQVFDKATKIFLFKKFMVSTAKRVHNM